MRISSNAHTHTQFGDGRSTAEEIVRRALELGFTSLGFSEHADTEIPVDWNAYIAEIDRLKAACGDRLRIRTGIELDRLSDVNPSPFEYYIAANHYFLENGDLAAIDGDADQLEAWVNRHLNGDWARACARYFDEYATFIETQKPAFVAHFDLIVKNNRARRWFDEASEAFLAPAREALSRVIRVCDVLELNTGGIARSHQPVPYPVQPILKHWRALGGRVIVNSDCHRAAQLDAWFDQAPEYLREAGFTHALQMSAGEKLFDEIRL